MPVVQATSQRVMYKFCDIDHSNHLVLWHVIKCGDFPQFPPVGNDMSALYMGRPNKDNKQAQLGGEIFLQFDKVIILKKQNRIKDKIWNEVLNR